MQNRETGQKTRIKYEGGQYVKYVWVHSAETCQGQQVCDLGSGEWGAGFQTGGEVSLQEGEHQVAGSKGVERMTSREVKEEEATRARARNRSYTVQSFMGH